MSKVSEKILKKICYRDKPHLLAAMFLTDQISFAVFVEGHLRNIPVKFG